MKRPPLGKVRTHCLLLLVLALAWTACARAQDWPQKTVRVINPYAPGTTTDIVARLIADRLQRRTGKPFIVETKTGGGGSVGTQEIARASPDGYTFGVSIAGPLAHNTLLRRTMPYDPLVDLAPLALAVHQPCLLISTKALGAASVQALIAEFRKRPKGYNYALVGSGTLSHLLMVKMLAMTGTELEPISYPGTGQAISAMIAGDVHIACLPTFIALGQARAGKVNLLGISAAQRSPLLPEVPTLVEQGLPDLVGTAWMGVVAPARTPKPLLDLISRMVIDALRQPDVAEMLGKQMVEVIAGTPDEYTAFVRDEIRRWKPVIEDNKIVLEE
jgi:tripartite-type tricarboxylate transporter receptor subunit TctC